MKLKLMLSMILGIILLTGCSSIGPRAAGLATGKAVYLGY